MAPRNLHALPTETFLDQPGADLARERVGEDVLDWLKELAQEPDLSARCGALMRSLRKQNDPQQVVRILRGLLAVAVQGRPAGAAGLAGLLAVWAPGETLVMRIRGFDSLRRQSTLVRRAAARGEELSRAEQALLDELDAVAADIGALYLDEVPAAGDEGERKEVQAWEHCRRVFEALLVELEATGTLGPEALERFLRIARLELQALESRASHLAESIDPYSARQVSRVMPILGDVDADLRDMRAFLDELDETRRVSLFHQQRPAYLEVVDTAAIRAFLHVVENEPRLAILLRLLRGLDRNPLSPRTLAWFTDRVVAIGEALQDAGVRRQRLDLVHALLVVLDFHKDGILQVPVSGALVETLRAAEIDAVEIGDHAVRVVFDPLAARRLILPYDLPALAGEEGEDVPSEEQETVKDLVLSNINNTSVLLGLLKNQKVVNTPGVVAMVVQRCRNMRVIEVIAHSRNLHSGFANKDVPLALLRSPMNIPVKTLRRFISVRYVSKVELRRLAVDRSSIRREVASEVAAYLKSLA